MDETLFELVDIERRATEERCTQSLINLRRALHHLDDEASRIFKMRDGLYTITDTDTRERVISLINQAADLLSQVNDISNND